MLSRCHLTAPPHHDVRGNLIEEPAVVADNHCHPVPCHQCLLQRAQRRHVQVVRGLVQHEHVAAAGKRLGQLQAVALPAGQLANDLRYSQKASDVNIK